MPHFPSVPSPAIPFALFLPATTPDDPLGLPSLVPAFLGLQTKEPTRNCVTLSSLGYSIQLPRIEEQCTVNDCDCNNIAILKSLYPWVTQGLKYWINDYSKTRKMTS